MNYGHSFIDLYIIHIVENGQWHSQLTITKYASRSKFHYFIDFNGELIVTPLAVFVCVYCFVLFGKLWQLFNYAPHSRTMCVDLYDFYLWIEAPSPFSLSLCIAFCHTLTIYFPSREKFPSHFRCCPKTSNSNKKKRIIANKHT